MIDASEQRRRWREANARYRAKDPKAYSKRQMAYMKRSEKAKQYIADRRFKARGITRQAYEALLAGQGFCCAVCRVDTPTKIGWVIDHDHDSGDVRGVLCSNCNIAIGQMKDDPQRLRDAAKYLELAALK